MMGVGGSLGLVSKEVAEERIHAGRFDVPAQDGGRVRGSGLCLGRGDYRGLERCDLAYYWYEKCDLSIEVSIELPRGASVSTIAEQMDQVLGYVVERSPCVVLPRW